MAQDVNHGELDVATRAGMALQHRLGVDRYQLWIQDKVRFSQLDNTLCVIAGDPFTLDLVRRRFRDDMQWVASDVVGLNANVQWEVDATVAGGTILPMESASSAKNGLKVCPVPTQNSNATGDSDYSNASNRSRVQTCLPFPEETSVIRPSTEPMQSPHRGRTRRVRSTLRASDTPIDSVNSTPASTATTAPLAFSQEQPNLELPLTDAFQDSIKSISLENAVTVGGEKPVRRRWDEIVRGNCNRLAITSAEMLIRKPGSISPLLLYGPCGVGKTLLVQAIIEQVRRFHRQHRVIYLSAEHFTNDFTEALRGSGLPNFRRRYRDVDLLVIDDIQFFLGKRATLVELRHTIDTLLRSGCQIVLCADRSLPELTALGPELHARLTGGMACSMEPLDSDTRFHILKRLCYEFGVQLTDQQLTALSGETVGDARVLAGMVKRLFATQTLEGRPLSSQECVDAVSELVRSSQPAVRISDIERAVCEVFGLDSKSLQSKGKSQALSQPRMLAMFLARKYTRAAYAEIGEYFGHRRHSTVISAENKVDEWLQENATLKISRGDCSVREALRHVQANLQLG